MSYLQDNEVFADAFNFYMFDGEQVIKPEELHPLDTTAIALPFGDDSPSKPVQKYRDVLKYISIFQRCKRLLNSNFQNDNKF